MAGHPGIANPEPVFGRRRRGEAMRATGIDPPSSKYPRARPGTFDLRRIQKTSSVSSIAVPQFHGYGITEHCRASMQKMRLQCAMVTRTGVHDTGFYRIPSHYDTRPLQGCSDLGPSINLAGLTSPDKFPDLTSQLSGLCHSAQHPAPTAADAFTFHKTRSCTSKGPARSGTADCQPVFSF